MAVKITGAGIGDNFIALSSDDPPKVAMIGATLTHLDTGEQFIWDGNAWQEDLRLQYALQSVQGII